MELIYRLGLVVILFAMAHVIGKSFWQDDTEYATFKVTAVEAVSAHMVSTDQTLEGRFETKRFDRRYLKIGNCFRAEIRRSKRDPEHWMLIRNILPLDTCE